MSGDFIDLNVGDIVPADTKITDIVIVNGALTTVQLIQIETYLNILRGGIY